MQAVYNEAWFAKEPHCAFVKYKRCDAKARVLYNFCNPNLKAPNLLKLTFITSQQSIHNKLITEINIVANLLLKRCYNTKLADRNFTMVTE